MNKGISDKRQRTIPFYGFGNCKLYLKFTAIIVGRSKEWNSLMFYLHVNKSSSIWKIPKVHNLELDRQTEVLFDLFEYDF